ncbi:LytTR family DNA-binding domain-containing protein [Flavicella sp.]|uniref:LytR/AlgR family response regulator transcription factor n=1 Tax=Flavicella sp. TaxID=2957742 RepID=UPI00301B5CE4
MITCILIDDEAHNLENLRRLLLKNCPNVEVVALANSAEEGIELIKEHKPDLVFLDIEMPNKNGFQMLESIPKITFQVIFVTAYDQYVLKAMRSCALDYLMKPVSILELKQAVLKVSQVVSKNEGNKKLKVLFENLKDVNLPQKIILSTAEELFFVPIKDIIRCKGESNYTQFFLTDGSKILVSKTLKEWDNLLCPHQFIRTHQSHLINSLHVSSYVKKDGGYIVMKDGSMVSVSRLKKEEILKNLASLNLSI